MCALCHPEISGKVWFAVLCALGLRLAALILCVRSVWLVCFPHSREAGELMALDPIAGKWKAANKCTHLTHHSQETNAQDVFWFNSSGRSQEISVDLSADGRVSDDELCVGFSLHFSTPHGFSSPISPNLLSRRIKTKGRRKQLEFTLVLTCWRDTW